MSSKIRVLNENTINKIAAGEIIENPSSVVKELVENAVDAGSTEICIEIQGGGRQLIRISDNGCGMSSDDALLCLERHATSKLRDSEDLHEVLTMGFRGEAIPSIASISKFTILTSENKNLNGTLIRVEGGKILSQSTAVRTPGTTFEVKSIFYNVPVRKKFQRSPTYDTQEILKMVSILSLAHPQIQFELISDGKHLLGPSPNVIELPFVNQLSTRIEMSFGQDFRNGLQTVDYSDDHFTIRGFIGIPSHHRPNRTGQYLVINHRPVQSPTIAFAIREGYGSALPSQRYPVFVLHLQMAPKWIDVNVHPQKKEVRLRHDSALKQAIIQAVQNSLHSRQTPLVENTTVSYSKSSPFDIDLFKPLPEYTVEPIPLEEPVYQTSYIQPIFDLETKTKIPPRPIATLPGFIMIDPSSLEETPFSQKQREGLCVLDQKAALARIHYERLKKTESKEPLSQPLLLPITLELPRFETEVIQSNLALFQKMGFEIQEIGNHHINVIAIPEHFEKEDVKANLLQIIEEIIQEREASLIEREREKRIANIAAKLSSTKRLSLLEAQQLISQLILCESPYTCPSGHATVIFLSSQDFSKYFHK